MNTETKMDCQDPECEKMKKRIAELEKELLRKLREFNYLVVSPTWSDFLERSMNFRKIHPPNPKPEI